ncbi:hypothetical protein CEXT_223481 [Caerostris extrusa]|uniref:Uncharacterized protein n=1 Tax=Caerostris extrusa TaxID=172846 RepID=A0AAV4XTI1_CAEEX|nr:hypothetical protein CEXT_223481 [Caerostris extrusa]
MDYSSINPNNNEIFNHVTIAIVGQWECGKTSLVHAYLRDRAHLCRMQVIAYPPSCVFIYRFIQHDTEMTILDVNGLEAIVWFGRLLSHYSHAVLLCYNVDDRNSMFYLHAVFREMRRVEFDMVSVHFILVGTKRDLRQSGMPGITFEEGEDVKHDLKFSMFFECSSLDTSSVDRVFNHVIGLVLGYVDAQD